MRSEPTPEDWAHLEKDLNRTDRRREWRYYRDHKSSPNAPEAADPSVDPLAEAACREFLARDRELIDDYRRSRGRRKQRLRNLLLERLARAGFIGERQRALWNDYAPCHWAGLASAA